MREILFKAKRTDNGEWVEGSLIVYPDGDSYICCDCYEPDILNKYKVDPETVCQYTGENDKDNTMIFENDIVEIPTFKPQRMVVRFLDGVFCLTNKEGKYVADIYYIHHAGINNTKVTGNIFDNLELLEVE